MRAIISTLQTRVLPYAALLITPLVASLAHSSACIRHEASAAFGQLMPLLPLEPGTADPTDMSAALRARKAAERPCVDQLLGVVVGGAPPRYELPMVLKTTLRPYQQAGVDWLAFLRRFGLHGILCDDMGLGKTLQTLCVLAAAAHEQRARRAGASERLGCGGGCGCGGSGGGSGSGNGNVSGSSGNGGATSPPANLPSIVVCPATLTAHWRAEATKFCGSDGLCVLEYGGSAQQRARLRSRMHEVELVVMSYETLRTDIDTLAQVGDHRTTAQSDCSLSAL
jgi:TATA-binding protein-associated factor